MIEKLKLKMLPKPYMFYKQRNVHNDLCFDSVEIVGVYIDYEGTVVGVLGVTEKVGFIDIIENDYFDNFLYSYSLEFVTQTEIERRDEILKQNEIDRLERLGKKHDIFINEIYMNKKTGDIVFIIDLYRACVVIRSDKFFATEKSSKYIKNNYVKIGEL